MIKFTESELRNLIDSGNGFASQIATQCLVAEQLLSGIIDLYFEGCDNETFDDRMREIKAVIK